MDQVTDNRIYRQWPVIVPALLAQKQINQLKKLYDARKNTVVEICKIFTISRPTFYNYINQVNNNKENKVTRNKKRGRKAKS